MLLFTTARFPPKKEAEYLVLRATTPRWDVATQKSESKRELVKAARGPGRSGADPEPQTGTEEGRTAAGAPHGPRIAGSDTCTSALLYPGHEIRILNAFFFF